MLPQKSLFWHFLLWVDGLPFVLLLCHHVAYAPDGRLKEARHTRHRPEFFALLIAVQMDVSTWLGVLHTVQILFTTGSI